MSDPLGYRVGVYQSVLDGLIWRQNLQLSKWARWDIHGFQNSINGYRGYVYLHPLYYHNLGPCLGLEVGIELPDYTQVTLLGFPKNEAQVILLTTLINGQKVPTWLSASMGTLRKYLVTSWLYTTLCLLHHWPKLVSRGLAHGSARARGTMGTPLFLFQVLKRPSPLVWLALVAILYL